MTIFVLLKIPCMGTGEFGNDIGVMFDGDYCEQSVNNSLSFNGIDNYVLYHQMQTFNL